MTAIISKIKSKADVQQLPVTHERAVRDDNGTTLETKLQMIDSHYNKDYEVGNGMGKKTLPKNNGVLTQEMMPLATGQNTIYVIQYDYVLGENVTVPANCILEFDGGSVSGNGSGKDTLTFNNTNVKGTAKNSFRSCRFNGTINNDYLNVQHYGITPSLADCSDLFNDIMNICTSENIKKVYIPAGTYTTYHPIIPCSNIEIYGDGDNTEIYNAQTTGPDKHIFICSSFPAFSTGAARNQTKYSVVSISDDRKKITVSNAQGSIVGNLCALFSFKVAEGFYSFTYVGKIVSIDGNDIEVDYPVPYIGSDVIEYAPDARGTDTNAWFKENVYVHDMYLHQLTNTNSGYYAIASGYKCVFENLKIHASTTIGSNLAAHCVYKNIIADVESGYWDDAELSFDNLYENIVITKYDARLNNIGFNVTNGSYNVFKDITLLENSNNKAYIGGVYTSFYKFENITIIGAVYNNVSTQYFAVLMSAFGTIKNLVFKDCKVLPGSGTIPIQITLGDNTVNGVYGIFDCAEGVVPYDRFHYTNSTARVTINDKISNIMLNKEFSKNTPSIISDEVYLDEVSGGYGIGFIPAVIWNERKTYGDLVLYSKFNLVNTDSEVAISNSDIQIRFGEVYGNRITIPFTYDFTNELFCELVIVTDAESYMNADLTLTDYKGFVYHTKVQKDLSGLAEGADLYFRTNTASLKTTIRNNSIIACGQS